VALTHNHTSMKRRGGALPHTHTIHGGALPQNHDIPNKMHVDRKRLKSTLDNLERMGALKNGPGRVKLWVDTGLKAADLDSHKVLGHGGHLREIGGSSSSHLEGSKINFSWSTT
jgi:hypothetical protein